MPCAIFNVKRKVVTFCAMFFDVLAEGQAVLTEKETLVNV